MYTCWCCHAHLHGPCCFSRLLHQTVGVHKNNFQDVNLNGLGLLHTHYFLVMNAIAKLPIQSIKLREGNPCAVNCDGLSNAHTMYTVKMLHRDTPLRIEDKLVDLNDKGNAVEQLRKITGSKDRMQQQFDPLVGAHQVLAAEMTAKLEQLRLANYEADRRGRLDPSTVGISQRDAPRVVSVPPTPTPLQGSVPVAAVAVSLPSLGLRLL